MVNNPLHHSKTLARKFHALFTHELNQIKKKSINNQVAFTTDVVVNKFTKCIAEHSNYPISLNPQEYRNDLREELIWYNDNTKSIIGQPDILLETDSPMAIYYAEHILLRNAKLTAANNYTILAEAIVLLSCVQYFSMHVNVRLKSLFCLACKNATYQRLLDFISKEQLDIPNINELPEMQQYCFEQDYNPALFKQTALKAKLYGITQIEADNTFLMFFGMDGE